ncbi:hypothetical protein Cme02nite_63740 [Catellatospora methionotrophica]|uniref:Uncharacterized protein n=1 Tax=Catellatospora methionotrophica TaxID=121620 RepID=A0A8J3LBU1_9ACTN|nr:hypothetical protein [Catellatospora methionotrophica]GIG18042.1 hypothetical protein Cme02nite_63740 [Catellatospora methionotrophica]
MRKSAQRVRSTLPEQPPAPPGVDRAVLMTRLWVVVVTVAFVLGLVSLDCDPYLALTGGVAVIAAAIRLTRK